MILLCDHFIGIEHKNQVAGCMFETFVASGAKVINPNKINELSSNLVNKTLCNLFRLVRRSGISNNQFVNEAAHGLKTLSKNCFFIFHNHAQREFHCKSLKPSSVSRRLTNCASTSGAKSLR